MGSTGLAVPCTGTFPALTQSDLLWD